MKDIAQKIASMYFWTCVARPAGPAAPTVEAESGCIVSSRKVWRLGALIVVMIQISGKTITAPERDVFF
jgi:hypothetical protein